MRILVIDNNILKPYWGAKDLARFAAEAPGATLEVRRAPQGDLPSNLLKYDRVVISGSVTSANEDAPWIAKLEESIRRWIENGTPLLGVCYGHQMIARTLGGKQSVGRAARPEFGWSRIDVLNEDPLFEGLPQWFYSYSSHYDEVCDLHPSLKLLARSEICGVQAYAMEGKPVWGIQFHPEKNLDEATTEIRAKIKKGEPKELLNPQGGQKLFDPKVGEVIFRNFFRVEG
jgi:GMP synthase (glutamine-hydrolysing)